MTRKKIENAEFGEFSFVWLETFILVARSPDRKSVADAMGTKGAMISKHVGQLSDWLGKVLVWPNSVPPKLTAHGEEFLPVAERLLEDLRQARTPRGVVDPPKPKQSGKDIRVPQRAVSE